jgi:hypothetical protein
MIMHSICLSLLSQDMSIEFSVEWRDTMDFTFKESEYNAIRPAFLNITYRNISNKPLYCLKITEGNNNFPKILYFYNFQEPPPDNLLRVTDDYFKRKYIVGFKSMPYYNMPLSWDICNDTTDVEYKIIQKTWERPIYDIFIVDEDSGEVVELGGNSGVIGGDTATLNDWLLTTLDGIYNYLHYYSQTEIKEEKKEEKEQWYHYFSDITHDTIINNSLDKFVFLKPGETYVDKYNLIGFQITGGTFTFQLDDTKSLDYIEGDPIFGDEAKSFVSHYQRRSLPLKVGKYGLFIGNFLTNKVTVQFPNPKQKNN